jgi:hypothetical protein
MPDALAKQVADAVMTRVAAIAGMGDTGMTPRDASMVSSFPAVFLFGDEEEKVMRTMGGAQKTCTLNLLLGYYVADIEAYKALHNLVKSIEDALEASPFDLGVEGVFLVYVTDIKRHLLPPPLAHMTGFGECRVRVSYNQLYGSA